MTCPDVMWCYILTTVLWCLVGCLETHTNVLCCCFIHTNLSVFWGNYITKIQGLSPKLNQSFTPEFVLFQPKAEQLKNMLLFTCQTFVINKILNQKNLWCGTTSQNLRLLRLNALKRRATRVFRASSRSSPRANKCPNCESANSWMAAWVETCSKNRWRLTVRF